MAARRPRDGAEAVAAAADENANPCKKARIDDDLLRRTMATIGAPPAAPDLFAVPTTDVVRHLDQVETTGCEGCFDRTNICCTCLHERFKAGLCCPFATLFWLAHAGMLKAWPCCRRRQREIRLRASLPERLSAVERQLGLVPDRTPLLGAEADDDSV